MRIGVGSDLRFFFEPQNPAHSGLLGAGLSVHCKFAVQCTVKVAGIRAVLAILTNSSGMQYTLLSLTNLLGSFISLLVDVPCALV